MQEENSNCQIELTTLECGQFQQVFETNIRPAKLPVIAKAKNLEKGGNIFTNL